MNSLSAEFRNLAPGETDPERLWALVGAAGLILAALAAATSRIWPVDSFLVFACPFRAVTGWPCPTCGATRSILALARGDIAASLRWHPLVLPVLASSAGYLAYAAAVTLFNWPRLRVRLSRGAAGAVRVTAAGAVLATWVFLLTRGTR